jgi:hypothetical protein
MIVFQIFLGAALALVSIAAAGRFIAPGTQLPRTVRFTTGAAVLSAIVFLILACQAGYWPVYAALPVALTALGRGARLTKALPRMPIFFGAVLVVSGAFYLIFALALETQPDAAGYHLRLVADYVRMHGFGVQDGFYDVLPQGMEMLYVPAFAFGAWSAAKLVHFAFLIAAVPLIRELGREAGLDNPSACAGATIFFLAPVCGIDGTSAYTDAGLVCACCSVVYLLIRWNRERTMALLLCAGINAGLCYAVKPTFGWVGIAAAVFVAVRTRRAAATLAFGCSGLLWVAPWLIRAYVLSGSAVAPFFSHWIPNSVQTPEMEADLAAKFGAFRSSFSWSHAWLSYTLSGDNQGIFGPAFLLVPAGLLALRDPRRRWLPICAALLAVPLMVNTGARFLMPAMALWAIAIASVLPYRAAFALVAIQAIAAAPPVLDWYDSRGDWRLGGLPLAAALRIEPGNVYLRRSLPEFDTTQLIRNKTPEDAGVLACTALPVAYVPREVLTWWHSLRGQQFGDALQFALESQGTHARLDSWRWPENRYTSLRVTALSDLRVISASLPHSPAAWNSWRIYRAGESISLIASAGVHGADVLIWPGDRVERTEVLPPSGTWRVPEGIVERSPLDIDLRKDATAYIRRYGYKYIVVGIAEGPFAEVGVDMLRHPGEWGVQLEGLSGANCLFRIRAGLF